MSFVRARPRIPVTIPTKRRPNLNSKSVVESNSVTKETPPLCNQNDPPTKEPESIINTVKTPEEKSNSTVAAESKPFFKRIKPPVQVPAKNSRIRPIPSESETPKSDQSVKPNETPSIQTTDQPSEPLEPETKVQERPATPTPPVLAISPTKSPVRHRFARPAVTDSIPRRHSMHASSASESEDDSRRNVVSRMRNISESSVPSRPIIKPESTIDNIVDVNECVRLALLPKKRKAKVSNHVRKVAEARRNFNRRFSREKPDRSNLKMFDLLFYNPHTTDENKVPKEPTDPKTIGFNDEQESHEDTVDDPEPKEELDLTETAMPVPQVKIGANGEIILDEKSLMIETTESRKGREALKNSVPIFEDRLKRNCYYGKKHSKPKDWTPVELKCFYKALNSIGTDFALMEPLFPGRTRTDLKNKFKREEKINRALIDKALSQPTSFNIVVLKKEFEHERQLVEEETKRKILEKERLEQERKENLECEFRVVDDMVFHRRNLCIENVEQTRRSKRKSVNRNLGPDYVDLEDSDENDGEPSIKQIRVDTTQAAKDPPLSKTEEIDKNAFLKLFENKLCKMQSAKITIEAPLAESDQVRLVLDVTDEENQATDKQTGDGMETVFVLQEEKAPQKNGGLGDPASQRSVQGLDYVVFRNDEKCINEMQSLKPGSIVAMYTDAPNIPLENRCSTFMMVKKESVDGAKVTAMPVVLPPEIMQSLLNDLSQT